MDILKRLRAGMNPISAKLFILWGTVKGLLKKMNIEHRTSNIECGRGKDEAEELIKIFVRSIKTAVRQAHGPERSRRAEKKQT